MSQGNPHDYLDQHHNQAIAELSQFVAIPSIAAQSDHADDVKRAAQWVADRMTRAGIENVQLVQSKLHPAVYGEWLHAPGKPTVLVYGHFDADAARPAAPLDLAPFEPEVRDNKLYGRGATDDKGNMFIPILATEALLQTTGSLPLNLKFIFEGQEEMGSPHMADFVSGQSDLLACDLVINADSGQRAEDQPTQTLSTRGICGLEFAIIGPQADVHSGAHGGAIQNPLHAISELIASFHDSTGKVAVAGFYDDVIDLPAEEREAMKVEHWDEAEELGKLGIPAFYGEPDYTPRERATIRPTLEINGIWGGYMGQGPMTVIPHVARQDQLPPRRKPGPEAGARCVIAHIESHTPKGVVSEVTPFASLARAYHLPADYSANALVGDLLEEMYGKNPLPSRTGGSVPILAFFRESLNAYSVGFGFGLPDEGIHGPDEYFRLSSFERGQHAYIRLFERTATLAAGIGRAPGVEAVREPPVRETAPVTKIGNPIG
ncbi:MAG: dipeptidase [Thermomicrobiales bacterium]